MVRETHMEYKAQDLRSKKPNEAKSERGENVERQDKAPIRLHNVQAAP